MIRVLMRGNPGTVLFPPNSGPPFHLLHRQQGAAVQDQNLFPHFDAIRRGDFALHGNFGQRSDLLSKPPGGVELQDRFRIQTELDHPHIRRGRNQVRSESIEAQTRGSEGTHSDRNFKWLFTSGGNRFLQHTEGILRRSRLVVSVGFSRRNDEISPQRLQGPDHLPDLSGFDPFGRRGDERFPNDRKQVEIAAH